MTMNKLSIDNILSSRAALKPADFSHMTDAGLPGEGGCGVIGMASNEQVAGRHLLQALDQMRNRGNGKGGGVAVVGLVPEAFGVTREVLDNDYMVTVAYLDPTCREDVEKQHIYPTFDVDHVYQMPHIADYRTLPSLDVEPPEVVVYFCRVKPDVRKAFSKRNQLWNLETRKIDDEVVYQNTFKLNKAFYAATGETRAFVLSHGKNLLVLKLVAYAEDVVRYYQLEDMHAHVWIGHHRYPTKGRVWHPGGAHPFIGMNEALVHNGDFANYASISEYLAQRHIYPLFLTDTEVSVQVFDLLYRTYNYPLEYVIEALAPTTERDFKQLPPEKQRIYEMLQVTHMHSSPDGPWFFLIAQSDQKEPEPMYRLTCITDTSMLRPQVFAWQENPETGTAIGFAASEKQGIDAALGSLAKEDSRFWARADRYWNARGGSHTDGGAFIFSVRKGEDGKHKLVCTDKFGRVVDPGNDRLPYTPAERTPEDTLALNPAHTAEQRFRWVTAQLPTWEYGEFTAFLRQLEQEALTDEGRTRTLETLTLLIDRFYPTGKLRRSSLLALVDGALANLFDIIQEVPTPSFAFVRHGAELPTATHPTQTAVIDARGYEPEGPESAALALIALHKRGFCRFVLAHMRGHRFIGNGFGADSSDIRIDCYGSPGDYLSSGIDGMEIRVHVNAQDQLAQIMKAGKLVVFGDVGQTFGYGAKGGEMYVRGNAAGRPLINAVGKPRVIINGTALDYLAESFMAGDPLNGGGFVILNGITLTDDGEMVELPTPYPGSNLFSLASGGAIYVRDPHNKLTRDQLNGGEFHAFTEADWDLIRPYLEENERLFGIALSELLEVEGRVAKPAEVYRKIAPKKVRALQAEEAWVAKH